MPVITVLFDILDETIHVRFGHRWVPELLKHYKYDKPVEELVAECQRITVNNTLAPAQREAARRKAK